jgi:hypothetical protein
VLFSVPLDVGWLTDDFIDHVISLYFRTWLIPKRFGDYTLSLSAPEPFDTDLVVPLPFEYARESAATA